MRSEGIQSVENRILTPEEKQRLTSFFDLLIQIDRRERAKQNISQTTREGR